MQLVTADLNSIKSVKMSHIKNVSEPSMCDFENTDLDRALTLTGYGCFHYQIVASCALCLIASGLQIGLSAFVLPAAKCELNLHSAEIGFLNVAFLIGGICSCFWWGIIADLKGRKTVLIISLLSDFTVTLICSLMQDFIGLLICRFLNGFLIGAPSTLTFTYLAEFHEPRLRLKSVYYSGVFFSIAWIMLPSIARIVLPLQISVTLNGLIIFSSWRMFLVILTLPGLIAGIWISLLPETPKYLATVNTDKTLAVLRYMYSVNTGKEANSFSVQKLESQLPSSNTTNNINYRGRLARLFENIFFQISKLFKGPTLRLTILLCAIMFSNMFGYFGLGLWLPELIARFDDFQKVYPDATISLQKLANFTKNTTINESCLPEFDNFLFGNTITMGASTLIANVLSGWLSGKFENKLIPLLSMFLGATSAGSIYWTRSNLQNLIASCIFQATMTIANISIGCLIVDLYPTNVNAIAISTAMFAGRVGGMFSNIVFGYLVDFNCEIALFFVTGVLFGGTILCLKIPNSDKKDNITETSMNCKHDVEISVISITSL